MVAPRPAQALPLRPKHKKHTAGADYLCASRAIAPATEKPMPEGPESEAETIYESIAESDFAEQVSKNQPPA